MKVEEDIETGDVGVEGVEVDEWKEEMGGCDVSILGGESNQPLSLSAVTSNEGMFEYPSINNQTLNSSSSLLESFSPSSHQHFTPISRWR